MQQYCCWRNDKTDASDSTSNARVHSVCFHTFVLEIYESGEEIISLMILASEWSRVERVIAEKTQRAHNSGAQLINRTDALIKRERQTRLAEVVHFKRVF